MVNIINQHKDIYFNLAAEEYLLHNYTDKVFMLWQSETSVVCGKHQNIVAEINNSFIRKHNIPVARRLSGGGTVFHGPGNVNFTFIMNGSPGKLVNFNYFTSPVIDYLKDIGVSAMAGGKNDLLIEGKKISGNAEHIFKNRILHHGTLLFNANLEWLDESLKSADSKYFGKAVSSNRSEVTNIRDHIKEEITINKFISGLNGFISDRFGCQVQHSLTSEEVKEIELLRKNKYSHTEWIYGYSPAFEVRSSILYDGEDIGINLKIEKGYIRDITCNEIMKGDELIKLLKNLRGRLFNYEMMDIALDDLKVEASLKEHILQSLF